MDNSVNNAFAGPSNNDVKVKGFESGAGEIDEEPAYNMANDDIASGDQDPQADVLGSEGGNGEGEDIGKNCSQC